MKLKTGDTIAFVEKEGYGIIYLFIYLFICTPNNKYHRQYYYYFSYLYYF